MLSKTKQTTDFREHFQKQTQHTSKLCMLSKTNQTTDFREHFQKQTQHTSKLCTLGGAKVLGSVGCNPLQRDPLKPPNNKTNSNNNNHTNNTTTTTTNHNNHNNNNDINNKPFLPGISFLWQNTVENVWGFSEMGNGYAQSPY